MHNGFVNIDNVKMSKSLGNFITVHDALKTIDGSASLLLATQHYRKPINFTEKAVRDAETNLKYLKNTYEQPFTGEVDPADLQALWTSLSWLWMKISMRQTASPSSLNWLNGSIQVTTIKTSKMP